VLISGNELNNSLYLIEKTPQKQSKKIKEESIFLATFTYSKPTDKNHC